MLKDRSFFQPGSTHPSKKQPNYLIGYFCRKPPFTYNEIDDTQMKGNDAKTNVSLWI